MNEALVNGSGRTSSFAVIWFVPSLQHVGQRSDLVSCGLTFRLSEELAAKSIRDEIAWPPFGN